MPRPVWAGAITFGLVTIPIKVVAATEDHSIRFHQYHLEDMGRIRTRKVCEIEDREVSQDEIGKGYEVSGDTLVAVSDAELREIPLPTAKAIEIAAFVPYESIDPIRIREGYYLEPDRKVAEKPYTLLRKALERNAKAAVAKFAWHGRERLGLLRIRDDAIVLHAMRWPDEIRSPESLAPKDIDVDDGEIDQAVQLIDSMTRDEGIEGAEWATDRYTQALEEVIHAKAEGKKPPRAETEEAPAGEVVDLMAALQQSVQRARETRGESDADVHELKPKKRAAKKTGPDRTARKTAAKKTAGKKTAATKTAAKQSAAKQSAAKKTTAKNTTAKKSPAKKGPAKKAASGRHRRSA
ncbi:Ku protein [Streptomyces aurantiacus]|uniref:Non-homologous end joining protein Ku n=1 Tax=Streptomyces aurantiacus JA 4570 TaxID=1286094 RepID=S3ZDW9_9ACTN|nr:Ku protein [Streptomyces aurantiacus]EPH41333.1 putative DNA repair protein [Streptomyces aurantiacus JA 4570]